MTETQDISEHLKKLGQAIAVAEQNCRERREELAMALEYLDRLEEKFRRESRRYEGAFTETEKTGVGAHVR